MLKYLISYHFCFLLCDCVLPSDIFCTLKFSLYHYTICKLLFVLYFSWFSGSTSFFVYQSFFPNLWYSRTLCSPHQCPFLHALSLTSIPFLCSVYQCSLFIFFCRIYLRCLGTLPHCLQPYSLNSKFLAHF